MKVLLPRQQSRTGYRDAKRVLLEEELPPGTGRYFTAGVRVQF